MTISSENFKNTYVGNGATSVYAYSFMIHDQSHLLVQIEDTNQVVTTKALTTDYTVSGVGEAAGGTITLVAGNLTLNYKLSIIRDVPLTQTTDLKNEGAFFGKTHEDALDRRTMVEQQLQEQIDRCLKLKGTETGTAALTELPTGSAQRASKVLGFDSSGNPTVVANVPTGSLIVSAYAETLLNDADAATARATLGFTGAGGTVDAAQIAAAAVTTAKLAEDSVDATILKDDAAVDANRAVTTNHIRDLAITTAKLAALSVTGAKIAAGTITADKLSSTLVTPQVFQARLTTASNTPITTTDQLAITTLYLTPYGGNRIALYDGVGWTQFALTEISLTVPATTSTMYDLYVYDAPGLTLEAVAWTNDTTRATALATQDGVLCKTGQLGRRYVGSFRTTGVSGQTEDSLVKRHVWNYYNRVPRIMRAVDTTNSWTQSTIATYRQARSTAANQLDLIVGVDETAVFAQVSANANTVNEGVRAGVGIGLDSTTATSAQIMSVHAGDGQADAIIGTASASYRGHIGIGRHFLAWLEISSASTVTWYGDNGLTYLQSGIHGEVMG
jgi:hypothetical protein